MKGCGVRSGCGGPVGAATGIVSVGTLGQPTPERSAGVVGSTESEDRGVEPGHRARSGDAAGSAAAADPSGCGRIDGAGVRTDHRRRWTLSMRETDCELCGTGSSREIERQSAALGSHHQTRPLSGVNERYRFLRQPKDRASGMNRSRLTHSGCAKSWNCPIVQSTRDRIALNDQWCLCLYEHGSMRVIRI